MKKLATLMIFTSAMLTGCGGGSSNSSTPVVTPPTDDNPTPVQTTLTVTVVDGYLENALIFADVNGNYQLDDGEPSATTNAEGQVEFDLVSNPEALTSPLIVQAMAGQTIDHTIKTKIRKSYSMIAPPASEVVSPLTTLAYYGAMTQQADITNVITSLQTELGLSNDVNIMADYLSEANRNEQLHAIARSLVQVLPNDVTQLLEKPELITIATNIAAEINVAVNQGVDPSLLAIEVADNNGILLRDYTQAHAVTFAEDVNTWGDHIKGGFLEAASDFAWQISMASLVVQDDVDELLSLYLDFAKAGLAAVALEQYITINANLVVPGAEGEVIVALVVNGIGVPEEKIFIDATYQGKTIQGEILINNEQSSASTFANLSSDTVTVTIDPDSSINLHHNTLYPNQLTIAGSIVNNAALDDKPVSFNGALTITTTHLTDSNDNDYVIPTFIDLDGEFTVGDSEHFSGGLTLSTTAQLVDDAVNLSNFAISVRLDAQFDDVPYAQFVFDLNQESLGTELTLTIVNGGHVITIDIYINEDEQTIVLTNAEGIVLSIDLAIQRDRENLGQLILGANQMATVSKIDGNYVLTFADGQQLELF